LQLRLLGLGPPGLLVAAAADGLILIDCQAAMARLWYEQLLAQSPYPGQVLARPLMVACDPPQRQQFLAHAAYLSEWGMTIEDFGHALRLRTWPVGLPVAGAAELLRAIALPIAQSAGMPGMPRIADRQSRAAFAAELAEQAAMRAVIAPNEAEGERLVAELQRCQEPYRSPHGRPTMIMIGQVEIARRFGHPPADPRKLGR
jgi:DNA mismatch repair protein MutL